MTASERIRQGRNQSNDHIRETLIELGQQMADLADALRNMEPLPAIREAAADAIDDGLDRIDEAIETLQG